MIRFENASTHFFAFFILIAVFLEQKNEAPMSNLNSM